MGIFVKENTKFENVEERKKKQQAIDMYGQEGELKLERERKQSKAKQRDEGKKNHCERAVLSVMIAIIYNESC